MQGLGTHRSILLAGTALVAIALSTPALAQKAPPPSEDATGVSDIVVTARKSAERLQDVPLAVNAFSDVSLARQSIIGLRDLAQATPGLTFQDTNGSYQQPVLRGLGQAAQSGVIGNVGVFLDGVFLNNRAGLEFGSMDLARIEVVKGPQSALYGRNTFAGAINYVTRDPDMEAVSGVFSAEVGNYDRHLVSGSLSVPIGETLAVRAFGAYSEFDGTIRNDRDGQRLGGWKERRTLGASLLWQPTPQLRVKAFYMDAKTEMDPTALTFLAATNNDCGSRSTYLGVSYFTLRCAGLPVPTSVNVNATTGRGLTGSNALGYINAAYDFGFATLTALGSYQEASFAALTDTTADPAAINLVQPGTAGLARQSYLNAVTDGSDEYSLDLRLASNKQERLTWAVGGYVSDAYIDSILSINRQTAGQPNSPAISVSNSGGRLKQKSASLFGSIGYDVQDNLNVQIEGRYTNEKQTFAGRGSQLTAVGGQTFDYFTPRATINYRPNAQVLIYSSAARGFKSGGFNSNAFGRPQFTYGPETNWTYELGVKSTLLDGKLIANANIFYAKLKDVQGGANIPGSSIQALGNLGGETSKGIEGELTYNITRDFYVRVVGSAVNPKYSKGYVDGDISAACGNYPGTTISTIGCSDIVGGNQLARISRYQASVSGGYTLRDVVSGYDAYVRADYSYQSPKFTTGYENASQGKIAPTNARIGVTNGSVEVAFWVRNLFDVKYLDRATEINSVNDGAPLTGISGVRLYPGERRTLGVRADYRF